ncbi:hypothetical protein BKA67DRAFT_567619 [Truncatella angustata]|uniref:Uncharacterized protein n=1 Tax=Truncatella angustata TaxID=152316 RepID=A0A9P8UIU9_9PEZI|nr:uncharacterized protein BKA67DRAFT_567619 [Truncatella angustata]KAH6652828.1 hypothetical protein BKA67DRAFT_567619 [Truncatella angustata]
MLLLWLLCSRTFGTRMSTFLFLGFREHTFLSVSRATFPSAPWAFHKQPLAEPTSHSVDLGPISDLEPHRAAATQLSFTYGGIT